MRSFYTLYTLAQPQGQLAIIFVFANVERAGPWPLRIVIDEVVIEGLGPFHVA
jgi:hypothetical protein